VATKKIKKKKLIQSGITRPQQSIPGIKSTGQIRTTGDGYTYYSNQHLFNGRKSFNILIFLLLVLSTLILYSGNLTHPFFRIDDNQYVVNNPWIREISWENISHILTTPYFVNYSPLHLFSYMLDYSFNGADPYVFHLSSNLWAGLVAGFVFLLALALTGRHLVAVPAAILFVLHPAHVEAVEWISSRKDLVAAAFAIPSLIAYIKYRKDDDHSKKWYFISLLLFLCALAGKLSVATFPAVFLALDLFVEKRPFRKSIADKIPYLVLGLIMAAIVASAQPPTGSRPDPFVILSALVQNFWLITGFGNYVIYRVAPEPLGTAMSAISILALLGIFLAPLRLQKKFPLAVTLFYWIIFAFIPTQILSFAYPVTDRYLFFPSVAFVILLAAILGKYGGIMNHKFKWLMAGSFLLIGIIWGSKTIEYINEWGDPRTVWYAASKKSDDPQVYFNLGWNYMDQAARLGKSPRKSPLKNEDKKAFAIKTWEANNRLPELIAEWDKNLQGGPAEIEFQKNLRQLAHASYNLALEKKGKHIMPDFFFFRGLLNLDEGKLPEARAEFHKALDEVSSSTFIEGNQEVLVNSHYNLGIVDWTEGNYTSALKWIVLAESEQKKFGGNWVPDMTANRQRLEEIVKITSGK
jgi:hypothetical protein